MSNDKTTESIQNFEAIGSAALEDGSNYLIRTADVSTLPHTILAAVLALYLRT